MSTLLLSFRPPSERVSVRPWAVVTQPNAEQARAARKAAAAERRAQRLRGCHEWRNYAVGFEFVVRASGAAGHGVCLISIRGAVAMKPLELKLKRILRAEYPSYWIASIAYTPIAVAMLR